jgi:mannose-1-phosphate guanylyltransferase
MVETDLWVMIMAGGSGTRFWPASRKKRPKQLLPILGQRPMLRRTVDRVLPLVGAQRIMVVSGQVHGQGVRDLLPDLPPENILLEPQGRNTAAACGLAAQWLMKKQGGGAMAVLSADALIDSEEAFRQDLALAARVAAGTRRMVTVGLVPTRPETGYGYLEQGPGLESEKDREVFELASFREKPDKATAGKYLEKGGYFWNAGIFVWEAETLLCRLREFMPGLARDLEDLGRSLLTPEQDRAMERIYPGLQAQSIDFGIMEKAEEKYMVPATFKWSDVGSWEEIYVLSDKDDQGNAGGSGNLFIDSRDCLVESKDKLVALMGVENLVVVETGDALLIMDRDRAQEMGRITDMLKKKDRLDLL